MFILSAHFYTLCLTSGRSRCTHGTHTSSGSPSSNQEEFVFANFPSIYISLTTYVPFPATYHPALQAEATITDWYTPAQRLIQSQHLYLWLWTSGSTGKSITAMNKIWFKGIQIGLNRWIAFVVLLFHILVPCSLSFLNCQGYLHGINNLPPSIFPLPHIFPAEVFYNGECDLDGTLLMRHCMEACP